MSAINGTNGVSRDAYNKSVAAAMEEDEYVAGMDSPGMASQKVLEAMRNAVQRAINERDHQVQVQTIKAGEQSDRTIMANLNTVRLLERLAEVNRLLTLEQEKNSKLEKERALPIKLDEGDQKSLQAMDSQLDGVIESIKKGNIQNNEQLASQAAEIEKLKKSLSEKVESEKLLKEKDAASQKALQQKRCEIAQLQAQVASLTPNMYGIKQTPAVKIINTIAKIVLGVTPVSILAHDFK